MQSKNPTWPRQLQFKPADLLVVQYTMSEQELIPVDTIQTNVQAD